jgi:hypothetical protein
MPDHKTILNAEAHEPKHITDTTTADAGKVITPSSITGGESELRNLNSSEVTNKRIAVTAIIDDVSTISSGWVVSPVEGDVVRIDSVIDGAIDTADATLTARINGIAMGNGSIIIDFTGSAAGDTDSTLPSGSNTVNVGEAIQIETNGASTNAVKAIVTFYIVESS